MSAEGMKSEISWRVPGRQQNFTYHKLKTLEVKISKNPKVFVLIVASKIGNKSFGVLSEWLFTAMFGGTKSSHMQDKVNICTSVSSISGMVFLRSPISLNRS